MTTPEKPDNQLQVTPTSYEVLEPTEKNHD